MASPGDESESKQVLEAQLRANEQELRKARDELEIKVAERTTELRRSERELRHVLDSIPALIHTARPDGYVDYFNQRWLQYVGLSLEDLLGWKWTAAIHPEDVEAIVEKMRSSMASGESFLHEARVRRADGEYRWMLHRKVALRDERGQIVKWYGSSLDIEERKQADETRRRNEFYLSEGQRLAHMGSWAFNPTGFEYWSSELFRVYGLNPSGKPPTVEEYLDLVHPEDREFVTREIQKMLANNSGFEFTKRIVRPDGKIRRVRCVGAPTNSAGTAQRFVGTGLDVTEQEQLMEALRERERELRQILDLAPQHIGVFGPDGSPLYANRATLEYLGVDIDRWRVETSRVGLVHPDDREHFAGGRKRRFLEGVPHEFEARLLGHDGNFRCFCSA